ncbi:MAG: pyruvate kinase [Elusimicrobia bacterium]|nr:pyruvate kinase [Elusimicrobiota bacterium]
MPTTPSPAGAFDLDLNHRYLHYRRTKIVATIGPASSSPAMLRKLIQGGLDVARINFSHGKAEDHVAVIRLIRKIAASLGRSVAVLGDLCGPKIRVGEFEGGSIPLKEGSVVTITVKPVLGKPGLIPSQYKNLAREVVPGHAILLDDGNLELKVLRKRGDSVEARVVRGGTLKNKKGMNLPNTDLRIPALTEKDKSDVLHCIKAGVDYLALSFVRKPADLRDLKSWLARHGSDIPVVAKIEMPEALTNIAAIIELADGIMVARGDLGVELPAKKVPIIQNKLIALAIAAKKPVIVATQMLESMIEHSRPTRAEVTDVSSACLAGADAVMMSAETASGRYPAESLETMDSILRETEAYRFFSKGGEFGADVHKPAETLSAAIGAAAAQLSRDLMARCMITLTASGYTARMISADRPAAPILAFTPSEAVARRLHLLWGVYPFPSGKRLSVEQCLALGLRTAKRLDLVKKGEYVLAISGLRGVGGKDAAVTVRRLS